MPRKSKNKSKRPAKKGARNFRGKKRRSGNVPEYASLSVKRSLAGPYGLGILYSLMNTSLDAFPRAVQVAQAYQHYRIKRIAVTFKSPFDSYVAAGGVVSTKPRLYYMIDKSGAIPTNIALEGLKAMGARPREIDEKPVVVSWAPSVLESTMNAVPNSIASKYLISPWLSTAATPVQPGAFVPSSVDHLGLYWYIDAPTNPAGLQFPIEVEVQFEFKKPLTDILSAVEAVPVAFAAINNSPDGVVGGFDDHLATNPSFGG